MLKTQLWIFDPFDYHHDGKEGILVYNLNVKIGLVMLELPNDKIFESIEKDETFNDKIPIQLACLIAKKKNKHRNKCKHDNFLYRKKLRKFKLNHSFVL